jgi:hypothetical protein
VIVCAKAFPLDVAVAPKLLAATVTFPFSGLRGRGGMGSATTDSL